MDTYKDNFVAPQAKCPLRVVIVGAGIAGLTAGIALKRAGHSVIILEQVHAIEEVGAGIQMAPNNTRILGRLGVLEELMKYTSTLTKNSLRRWKNDEELGTAPLMPAIGDEYGAPLGVIHRGDLQRILLEAAQKEEVEIRTASHVERCDDTFKPVVYLKNGDAVEGDVVIAADGIKSGIRKQIATSHDHVDKAMPTGDAAYRLLIPLEKMEHDKRALELINENVGMRWMGPGGHIMAYPIKNNKVYNMVLLHPQKPGTDNDESWNRKGDKKEMMEFYKDWNPIVTDLLSYVPEGEVMEWTLNSHRPLPSWHEQKVVLIGDACHPMLPYVAQGAAQAIEDAGVLGVVLSLCEDKDDIPHAIELYERVRKTRGEKIQQSATDTRQALHLPDGLEQQKRDENIRQAAAGHGHNPDKWADKDWQHFMWGVDVMEEAQQRWEHEKARMSGHHIHSVSASTYV